MHKTKKQHSPTDAIATDIAAVQTFQAGENARRRRASGDRSPGLSTEIAAGEKALEEFLRRHRGIFIKMARSQGAALSDLEDVLQELDHHCAKALLTWRPGGATPLTWVLRFARKTCSEAVRSNRLIPPPRHEKPIATSSIELTAEPSVDCDPAEEIQLRAILCQLNDLFDQRPCACTEVLTVERPWCCRPMRRWLRRRVIDQRLLQPRRPRQ